MLGNINPKYRSRIESIQLLTVIRTTLINKYGVNKILELFMEQINLLERVGTHMLLRLFVHYNTICTTHMQDSGVPFLIEGESTNLRGTLIICSADNPAACTLGGFKSLHSAFRKCRTCMAVDIDMQTKVMLSTTPLPPHPPNHISLCG